MPENKRRGRPFKATGYVRQWWTVNKDPFPDISDNGSGIDEIERSIDNAFLQDRLKEVLQTLTYRERWILKLRYGIGDGYTYTLEEVGRIFKVTRERVRQVEAKAIRKLMHPVRARKLEGFLDGSMTKGA